ncbi:hypothetical protein PtA15_16A227 [Puccinia triticina]|uniref:Uncharacterized protein n=1 Tax=Puccinia triticina TaxID=208348 RepID=A0ABY7D7J6_9BASI|nr:uncharacterized protein PtA15_16A227 [Puccinia triticina]WAQ92321.1 hypothetical protein PtA15_16A227 [Puccinia triticina]
MPATPSESSLSELDSSLSALSLLSDSDNEPLINRHPVHPQPPEEPMKATLVPHSDSDDEPLIKWRTAQPLPLEPTQATLVDSDNEPLINRHPVAGKSSVRNIPAKKKRIRKKTLYVLQSYAQLAKTSILCFC